MSSESAFFDKYPSFTADPTIPLIADFDRLAIQQNWLKGSKNYKKHKRQCLEEEFDSQYGITSTLEAWQGLYEELASRSGTVPIPLPLPSSITQCKKALSKIHVNLVDFIDCRRTGKPVKVFRTYKELQNYTQQTKKFYPRQKAKENGFLKVLLRGVKSK